MNREELLLKAKELTHSSGVYFMKDAEDQILYIGKAKSLRNRVISYFQKIPHELPRIELLISRMDHFDVILTETESEALILECTLIKKHKPRFNIRLKDDKTYPYIRIQIQTTYPRLEWTRKVVRDGARYFGPFPSAWSAKQVLTLLTETFQLRDCSDNTFRHRSRPCILHQIGRCSAPCTQVIGESEYREKIQEAIEVLEGRSDKLIESLKRGMEEAASHEEYEIAAYYRDQMRNLQVVTETQTAIEAGIERDRDVVGIAREDAQAHAALLQIRRGKLLGVRHFHLHNTDADMEDAQIISEFLDQYYVAAEKSQETKEGTLFSIWPQEVLIPVELKESDTAEMLEKAMSITVKVSEGEKDRQLLNVALANAKHALENAKRRLEGHGVAALEEVQKKLHLTKLPLRIECFDISNLQGTNAVASRVVFIDGAPSKDYYRRYKIKTVEGQNDFASMKEVLGRRFSNKEEPLPDLLVVDGGKGQLSQAIAILDELNVQGVEAVGLAKARTESDFQAPEVKSTHERIFIPGRSNPVPLLPHTSAYKLLTHVRDEAHRFAIQYHRLLRGKSV